MKPRNIVIGSPVTEEKKARSRAFRREMTPVETLLWERLRDRQIANAKFRRQQIIEGFIADFYCHEAALVIEADGATHEPQHDAERDAVFAGRGIATLRISNEDVIKNLPAVVEKIRQRLEAAPPRKRKEPEE